MRRHFRWDKKYLYWGVTAFMVIACAVLFYMTLKNFSLLTSALGKLIGILSPFIWGLVITYLLTPLMRKLRRNVFDPFTARLYKNHKSKDGSRLSRGLSVLVSEIVFLLVIAAVVYLIIPQIYTSLEAMVLSSSEYIARTSEWIERILSDYPEIMAFVTEKLNSLGTGIVDWLSTSILPELGSLVTNVTAGVYYVLVGIYNLLIGIIASVYILANVDSLNAHSKKLLYCLFTVENAEKIREATRFVDKTFNGFIIGKLLDSAIIGLICYIVCALLKMPYALLVSVIVGITNIIPFFGPFIGAIPSTLIILLVDPIKALIFVAFIIILQQLDGNVIGPKILGNTVGINGFWVMFSIIMGAGLFGFWGMLLGVPVFVVIYTGITIAVNKKLKKDGLPTETSEYASLSHIDPVTLKAVQPEEDKE